MAKGRGNAVQGEPMSRHGQGGARDENAGGEGGLAGVRAWAEGAVQRADRMLKPSPAPDGTPVEGWESADSAEFGRMAEELAEIERLLPDDDPLRAEVVPRLGVMLGIRYVQGEGG